MSAGTCAIARARLATYVNSLAGPSPLRERAATGIKAGFVGSVVTPARAIAGNASWGALRALVLQPVEAGYDVLASLARSAATGGKVSPAEFRTVANSLTADGFRAIGRGFTRGATPIRDALRTARGLKPGTGFGPRVATFVDELRVRLDAGQAGNALEHGRTVYKSRVAQTLVDAALAVVEAADRPFWHAAHELSVASQARLLALREGAKGRAFADRARHWTEHPTDEMLMRATDDANFATFKDRTLLAEGASWVKRGLARAAETAPTAPPGSYLYGVQASRRAGAAAASLGAELNVPFTGVPSAVAARVSGMSPLGLLSLAFDRTQAQRVRTLAHVSVGAAGMWMGYELASRGLLTGPRADSAADRADDEAAGRIPFGVQLGGHWVGVASLGPFAAPLFMGAALYRLRQEEPDAGLADQALAMGGTTGKYLLGQTYLSNADRVVQAAQDPRRFASLAASQIPTPAFLGQAERALDPVPREARTFGERVLDRVPGGNLALPRRLASFGALPDRTPVERAAAVLSPFPVSRGRTSPAMAELRRLGVSVGMPARAVTVGGRRVTIPDSAYRAMVDAAGRELEAAVRDAMADQDYRRMSDEDRRAWLSNLADGIRAAQRAPVRADMLGRTPAPRQGSR